MVCTNLTVEAAIPGVIFSNVGFGTSGGVGGLEFVFLDPCTQPGSLIGKPIIVGFHFEGTGIINILTVVASYVKDGVGKSATKTGVVSVPSGDGYIDMGANYESGNYNTLIVTGSTAV